MAKKSDALKYVNSRIGYQHDEDGIYPGQCADWVIHVCKKYFNWHFQGDAKDIINAKNRATAPKGTKFLPNTLDLVVQPLDICVWVGGQYGHVSIGLEGNLETFYSLDQNWGTWNGSPVKKVLHDYDSYGFWGVIRLPFINDLENGGENMGKKRIGTWNGVPVYTDFLPIGTRRTGQRLESGKPRFAVFHDTGNRDSTAQQNVNYYRNTYNIDWARTASAHIFVDDSECIICIPVTEKAWHVLYDTPIDNQWYGDDANDIAFGLEACYFSNRSRTLKSLDNSCRVMAALCNSWEINPRNEMPGHQQIQYDKQDPGNLLVAAGYGRNDISVLDNLVLKHMKGDSPTQKVAKDVKEPIKAKPPRTVWAWNGIFTARKSNTEPIVVRRAMGLDKAQVDRGSWIYPGEFVKFDQVIKDKKNSLWWIRFKYQAAGANKKDNFFMPIGEITDKEEKLLKEKALWGELEVK